MRNRRIGIRGRALARPAVWLAIGMSLGCELSPVAAPNTPDVTLTAVAGATPQSAVVGTAVPIAPSVRVSGADGKPLRGVLVLFVAVTAPGTVYSYSVETDADGTAASQQWQLGPRAGPYEMTAIAPRSTNGRRALFTATATPGVARSIATSPTKLSLAPGASGTIVTNLLDQFGNVVTAGVNATLVSSNSAAATVGPGGLVSAVGTGVARITVSFSSFSRDVWTAVGVRPLGTSVTSTAVTESPIGLAISTTGVAYVGRGASAVRFDLPGENSTATITGLSSVEGIAFLPNGTRAYLANFGDDRISIVDVATNTVLRTITGISNPARVVAAPGGAYVYVTTFNGMLHRIDTATDAITTLTLSGRLQGLALSGTSPTLFVSSAEGGVWDIDLTTFTRRLNVNLNIQARGLAVSLDGARLFVASAGGPLEVVSTTTLGRITTVPAASGAFELALTRDAAELYVVRTNAGQTMVIDADSYAVRGSLQSATPRMIAFNASGALAMITNQGGSVSFVR